MKKSREPFQITPETKIGTLLEHFPQLEETLLKMSPEFKKLRNPVIRKTIGRVATLRQVASIGKVSLADLINRLRNEAGIAGRIGADDPGASEMEERPSWFADERVVKSLDARPLLDRGEQPMSRVLHDCKNLNPGEIYELITPFWPAPLIAEAKKGGYSVWSREDDDRVTTYFTPKP